MSRFEHLRRGCGASLISCSVWAAFFEGSFRNHLSILGLTRFERFGVLVSICCVGACSHFILGRESSECSWFRCGCVPRFGITAVLPSFFLCFKPTPKSPGLWWRGKSLYNWRNSSVSLFYLGGGAQRLVLSNFCSEKLLRESSATIFDPLRVARTPVASRQEQSRRFDK